MKEIEEIMDDESEIIKDIDPLDIVKRIGDWIWHNIILIDETFEISITRDDSIDIMKSGLHVYQNIISKRNFISLNTITTIEGLLWNMLKKWKIFAST